MRFFSAVRLCISKTHWQAAQSLLFPISSLFQRLDAPFVFPPLFPTRRARVSPPPTVVTEERDDGRGAGRDTDEK